MLRAPVFWVPLLALAPLQSPLAVHDVGLLVALQLSVELPPVVTAIGLALKDTTGAGGTLTTKDTLLESLPPTLVQDRL
jgi:hypothetical protein